MALVLRLGSRGRSKGNPPSSSSSHIVFFSSSNSNSNSPFSLLFRDISENLKQPPPSQRASTDLIRENLNKFRARTTAPPPPPQKQISFQQLYNENIHGNPTPPKISSSSFNINSIRESLKNIRSADNTQTSSRPKDGWRYASPSPSPSPSSSSSTAFLRTYSVEDLGEKLRSLRPQAEGKDWFSVRELSERLGRLRKMEEESANSISSQDDVLSTVRGTLMKLDKDQTDSANKASRQGLSILSHLSGTPIFSLDPPKPLLLQKYFHPDNMSSADKMKIELAKVRDEFKMSESDCGSSRVQIALLTTKIKHLSAVLHKKDVHSRKGLVAMVQRRKKLLKYLRRTDWDSYCFVISKLGLRDNPDHVYKARTGMAA